MPVTTTEKIWHNGKLIPWERGDAPCDVARGQLWQCRLRGCALLRFAAWPGHFPRVRACAAPAGLREDLSHSGAVYPPSSLWTPCARPISSNGVWPCYIRPHRFARLRRDRREPVRQSRSSLHRELSLGQVPGRAMDEGVDVCVSSWTRLAPNTLPSMAKAGANYMNSQLIKMEAMLNGYVEGIALDTNGYVCEGSGENIFVVRDGKLLTPPLGDSVLPGITRDSILRRAASWVFRWSRRSCRAKCSTSPTRSSSPAPPPRSRPSARSTRSRSATATLARSRAIQQGILRHLQGSKPDRHNWLTPVPVRQKTKA